MTWRETDQVKIYIEAREVHLSLVQASWLQTKLILLGMLLGVPDCWRGGVRGLVSCVTRFPPTAGVEAGATGGSQKL